LTSPAAELFYDSSEGTEGKATIFLSFAYISDYLSVFRCLQDHHMRAKVEDSEHQKCVDLVFLRESTFSGREELDLWCGTFMTNIKEIGRVVLVALPFHSQTSSIDPRLVSIGSL
jgi:hypothetical protein